MSTAQHHLLFCALRMHAASPIQCRSQNAAQTNKNGEEGKKKKTRAAAMIIAALSAPSQLERRKLPDLGEVARLLTDSHLPLV